ncbi:hypothetical protein [Singulisphaera acidiphila]|uniref:Class I SAM-dependent methyltransferase n=1 Tax=Singulisphaera acidiphila (strain ATCC BAA-1392 / DSM 18658 / VKM B-2454 / MOB10) TaxID=886293 RepID=L0DHN1_SINAD|nr:hypothetical protein [Singulisphaera acidiphila]AGA28772.1 hypothetical protein Sinac_4594 [Singulisphaera acidiphila DSM 18658]
MNPSKERHLEFNAGSRGQWDGFAGHRERVTQLLAAGGRPGESRLCVLGAGNCNDLDLPTLLKAHGNVYLVDLDHDALAQGAERQGVAVHPALHRLGGIDLTGMIDDLANWSATTSIGLRELVSLVEEPTRLVVPNLPGPFDLVASTCLLSPLVGNAFHSVGESHPQFMAIVQSIRAGHLRLLSRLTAPGGTALLITDIVSSETLPALPTVADSALPDLMNAIVRERNYFHGVNPDVLWAAFEEDPVLRALVTERESLAPWRWKLHARLYLVWAIRSKVAPGLLR